ncbi:hypothetical protein BZG36_04118 [Bifiguratus adelaidae]|uniref:Glycosyl hydrolase family 32 N-terminal domain-containing protein n=1 Tax=Bifiguratus adelaidae TaxID=1938954 RepID=A0A261XXD8_9FUNG|nr:hypothetical protein BZG36_04118 [Bifiguratus adelaidae]
MKSLALIACLAGALALPHPHPPQPSPDLVPLKHFPLAWQKYPGNPIISPDPSHTWEDAYTYNPSAWVQNDEVYMIYRAQDSQKVSSFGLATSKDGYHFNRLPDPIFTPQGSVESHGVEDPRVVLVNGTYYMTYTAYNGTVAQLCLATSTDIHNWQRYGPMFPGFNVRSTDGSGTEWSKSGAILPWKQPNGQYLIYFGEVNIWYAYSPDLVHWGTPTLFFSNSGVAGQFDSDLVEAGPPPIQTSQGVLFVFNGAQIGTNYKNYSVGELLVDANDNTRILQRTIQAVMTPTTPEEAGANVQTPNVTFAEGLVYLKNKALLYYGQGDQTIGVATGVLN